jgi:two-component system cell cycle response regulator CpdR
MANILLAEDDASMRHFIAAALEKAGHIVTACEDGLTAHSALKSTDTYDFLLTDIVMPGMDGIELSQKAAQIRPGIKTMFITGFASMALSPEDGKSTQNNVISKPFHLNQLVEQIEKNLQD